MLSCLLVKCTCLAFVSKDNTLKVSSLNKIFVLHVLWHSVVFFSLNLQERFLHEKGLNFRNCFSAFIDIILWIFINIMTCINIFSNVKASSFPGIYPIWLHCTLKIYTHGKKDIYGYILFACILFKNFAPRLMHGIEL